jgi:tetratricopeptide (TPR) repeat protein
LADLPGTQRLPLETFSEAEALDLLRSTLGPGRVDTAPQVAAGIAGLVGCLPLALGLVAGRINDRPDWTLVDHLARLTERHQLRQLDSGIELALDLSYHTISSDLQQTLRLLAVHPGRDFDAYAAAALAGTDLPTTHQRLASLLAVNLLQRPTPTRFQFHDLTHIYAGARAVDDEPAAARQAALTRLFDSYLYTTSQAANALYPFDRNQKQRIPSPRTPTPPLVNGAEARAWLVAEYANLLAAVAYTATHGWPTHTSRFGALLSGWLYVSNNYTDALAVYGHALDAARTSSDRAAEGLAQLHLGWIHLLLGQYGDAAAALRQARRISRDVGDRPTEARSRGGLGVTNAALGRYPHALKHLSEAAAIFRQIGEPASEGRTLNNIGDLYERMGHYDQAISHYQQALAIGREVDAHILTGIALSGLSSAYARMGCTPEAGEYYQQALAIARENGYPSAEAFELSLHGLIYGADHPETKEHHQRAIAMADEIGAPRVQADVFNNIGEALYTIGRHDEALQHHQSALEVASQAGEHLGQAYAHDRIAHVMRATEQPAEARAHWREALALYTKLGSPLANEIRARLDSLDTGPGRSLSPPPETRSRNGNSTGPMS